ncbi:Tetratricopeptide repeat-containing protein [Ectothiorhodospira magna]|uniref:Tetratricopeptide repeat-containing protein n=1 Tax=Ectothiorhodospira magna TaxID=867345 RepID=A0A1H9GN11_9GAMM|nr:tetratricopeptide repeat protein [Ectothiorhodospira magna]SEQ51485.1 Tetratricopeptide repeat-containing protein [Ectothiorhodospira magna]
MPVAKSTPPDTALTRLLNQGRWAEAIPLLQGLIQSHPREPTLLNVLGKCLLNTGQHAPALAALRRSLAVQPDTPETLANAALCAAALRDYQSALGDIARAVMLAPNELAVRLVQIKVMIAAHRWSSLGPLFTELRSAHPNAPGLNELYIAYLLHTERYTEAEPLIEALVKSRRRADDFNQLGNVLMNTDRLEEAQAAFRKGVQQIMRHPTTGASPPKDYMDVSAARTALLALHQALGALKVPFFLAFGTFLGIHRDGELLPHDKDMDVGLPWKTPRLPLIEALLHHGFACPQLDSYRQNEPLWYATVGHIATGITIDFFFAKKTDQHIEMGFVKGSQPLTWRFRPFTLVPLAYAGATFQAPEPAAPHLAEVYGPNWQIPDANWDSCLLSPNLSPESRPLGLCFGYNRLLSALSDQNWKKAHGYCLQLQQITEDSLINKLRQQLERDYPQAWFPVPPARAAAKD